MNVKTALKKHALWFADRSKPRVNWLDVSLQGADLQGADLQEANLQGADLHGANLHGANLRGADLYGADLQNTKLPHYRIIPEEGSFIAYKKVRGNRILTLLIPEDAKRNSTLVGRKCRADKAFVLKAEFITKKGLVPSKRRSFRSLRDSEFIYRLNTMVEEPNYDADIREECLTGIHFFPTKQEAIEYNT